MLKYSFPTRANKASQDSQTKRNDYFEECGEEIAAVIVEPIAGVLGALLVLKVSSAMPIMLSFAAGAMIYVVVEELIPESQTNKRKDLMALFTIIGFIIMLVLDVGLG